MGFSGFEPGTFAFYEGLVADNSKIYWQAHKADYERSVKAPMHALLADLDEFGPFHVFRPYNDVRFSKNKVPYKLHIGAVSESEGGAINYVQCAADGMLAGTGYYDMATDQLERFRRAVDDDGRGREIERIADGLAAQGYALGAIGELKTAPRGYAKDHPRVALLRRKGLIMSKQWPVAKWMQTKEVVRRVRGVFGAAEEMNAWLDTHVGPSTLPPLEFH